MEQFIGTLKEELPKAFQSADYEKRKALVLEEFSAIASRRSRLFRRRLARTRC
jgi:hypothetical protein